MKISVLVPAFLAILCSLSSSPCLAQRAQPIGVSFHSIRAPSNELAARLTSQRAESDGQSRIGTWVVLGALAGAVAGGVWAAVKMTQSSSDDPMMVNGALVYIVGTGAVIGGIAGAFAYLVSHSQSQGR